MYSSGNLLPLVSLGPPSPHLTRHPRFPSLSTPPGLGGALLSAPGLPNRGGRAHVFPATRAPPAEQVSTRSPEARPSSSPPRPYSTCRAILRPGGCRARALPSEVGWNDRGTGAGPGLRGQLVSDVRGPDWGLSGGVVAGWRIPWPSFQ